VHHVGILYDQFMMHGQRNIKSRIELGPTKTSFVHPFVFPFNTQVSVIK